MVSFMPGLKNCRHSLNICMGESCKGAGARSLMERVRRQTKGAIVEEAPCLGLCDHAPVAEMDGNVIEYATATRLALRVGMAS